MNPKTIQLYKTKTEKTLFTIFYQQYKHNKKGLMILDLAPR